MLLNGSSIFQPTKINNLAQIWPHKGFFARVSHMRLLITTGIFRPELGGPATFAAEFARRLTSIGHEVTVITYSDEVSYDFDKEYNYPIVRVLRTQSKLKNYWRYFWAVVKHARKFQCIYTLDWFSAGVPVLVAATLTRRKYFVRVGGGYIWEKYLMENRPPVTLKEFYEKGIHKEYKLMYKLIKLVLQHATKVIFNTDIQRELYNKYYNLNPERTLTVFNAIPEHKHGALMHTYRNEPSFVPDKEIVFAGRFIKMKNVETLVRAFAKLQDSEFKLLLIGDGPTEVELKTIVKELDIEERVEFIPKMSQQDLYRRIANSYLVVIPSWTDISPHQVYECLSLGIPFLLTQENYLTINSYDFIKIDPHSVDDIAEKMNKLLDPASYQTFTKSLQTIEYSHGWNNVVAEHLKSFKEFV